MNCIFILANIINSKLALYNMRRSVAQLRTHARTHNRTGFEPPGSEQSAGIDPQHPGLIMQHSNTLKNLLGTWIRKEMKLLMLVIQTAILRILQILMQKI